MDGVAPPACSTAMNLMRQTEYEFAMYNLNLGKGASDHIEVQVEASKFVAGETIENTAEITFVGMENENMPPIKTNTAVIPIISCDNFSRVGLSALQQLENDAIIALLENGSISIDFLYFAYQNGTVPTSSTTSSPTSFFTFQCSACGCCSLTFNEFWDFFITGQLPLPTLWAFTSISGPDDGYLQPIAR